ncbi:MAG: hypothetical protein DDT22_00230 [candidate division WS2 bacterium]|nr:hypothetical protein [Candidatus Lithacetigena glycinireducens]
MKKKKRVNFTVTDIVYETWQQVSDDLIERRVFRSKTEIFESLVYFLQRSNREEILEFKSPTMII